MYLNLRGAHCLQQLSGELIIIRRVENCLRSNERVDRNVKTVGGQVK